MKKLFIAVVLIFILVEAAFGGTITGQIQTPSTGRGVANGTLTFTLTQAAVASGSATLAANGNCWTDSSGNVVGLPGDAAIAAPSLSSNLGSGSLGSGTYFVRYTWANATGESQPSSERSLALGSTGTLIVQAPANVPAAATSMKVYIGTAAGTETLQGSVAVTNGVIAGNYSQAVALVAGAALPASNTSVCQIRFNDELQPSFTAYSVALSNVNGAAIAGFPQKWYLSGGSNGTVNLSQGTPLYSGVVQYPQAVVANPAANGTQSINGPLSLNGYPLSNVAFNPTSFSGLLLVGNSQGQYPSVPACYAALSPGGTCMAPAGWSDPTWTSNLTLNKNNTTIWCPGGCYFPMGTFSLVYAAGVTGARFRGAQILGGPLACGTPVTGGTVFDYSGTGSAVQFGASSGGGESSVGFENAFISLCNAGTGAQALTAFNIGGHTRISNVFAGAVTGKARRASGSRATTCRTRKATFWITSTAPVGISALRLTARPSIIFMG